MAYPKVIIIGGGFAGINAAQRLKRAKVDILMIDKSNHHLFQPLLYQVATAALSPENIGVPLRDILRKQENAAVIMNEVVSVDKERQVVKVKSGEEFHYDYLIMAPGARHSYFGRDEWEKEAWGLKTLEDAIKIRERMLLTFEAAENMDSLSERSKALRFIVIGGGPTGVEMAGSIAELCHYTLAKNFKHIHPESTEVYLIEGMDQILPSYPPDLAERARQDLEKMGVHVLTGAMVTDVNKEGVRIHDRLIESQNIIWAAGNQASPLLASLNVPLDRQGRVLVNEDLSVPGAPNIFVTGDAAHLKSNGELLPAIAPAAIQEGRYAAMLIAKKIAPSKRPPFKYFDKGYLATIGRAKAVGVFKNIHLKGFLAWWIWCVVHIFYLISFPNRILVMFQWIFWYITGRRQARLIMKSDKSPLA